MIGSKELWKNIGIAVLIMVAIVVILNVIMHVLTGSPIMVVAALAAVVMVMVYKRYEKAHR